VYGFGEKKTPAPFVNACSKFLYLENLGQAAEPEPAASKPRAARKPDAEAKKDAAPKKDTAALKQDARLVTLLRNSVEAAAGEDGWANLSSVGTQIGNQASFDSRNYGYAKLGDLIKATELFDTEVRGTVKFLRDKRAAKAAKPA
jgi:uncharacterized LabA/DUF88 family protein